MNRDTLPETEAVLVRLWQETPAWRKWELMEDLNRAARMLALAGLRHRYPDASPEELRRRLADLLLGRSWPPKPTVRGRNRNDAGLSVG